MNMLTSAAAVVATAAPVAAQQPDPIYAAIERHRAAEAAYDATLGEDELEEAIPREQRRSTFWDARNNEPEWRVPTDHPSWIAHIEEGVRALKEEDDAAIALISTEGLTVAGARALLAYTLEREGSGLDNPWPDLQDGESNRRTWHYFMLCQVLDALEAPCA